MPRGSDRRALRLASAAGLFVAAAGLFVLPHLGVDLPGYLPLVLWAILMVTAAHALRGSRAA